MPQRMRGANDQLKFFSLVPIVDLNMLEWPIDPPFRTKQIQICGRQ
jgi:hypothetical protein